MNQFRASIAERPSFFTAVIAQECCRTVTTQFTLHSPVMHILIIMWVKDGRYITWVKIRIASRGLKTFGKPVGLNKVAFCH